MDNKIVGINGILSHGTQGTDLALKDLQELGYSTLDYNYPMRTTITSWFRSNREKDAQGLMEATTGGDHILAHSYGCLVVLEAMCMGANFGQVFFFGAAATSNRSPWFPLLPKACEDLYVIYNPNDRALRYGSLIPWHPFGKLGYNGYRGVSDSRIHNKLCKTDQGIISHSIHLSTHRQMWVNFIDYKLTRAKMSKDEY